MNISDVNTVNCCTRLRAAFQDDTLLDHIPYSESYDLISSSPVLYQNKKHNLFVTKDELGEWVVSICDIKLQFRELERILVLPERCYLSWLTLILSGWNVPLHVHTNHSK